jgi:hypothetical protein
MTRSTREALWQRLCDAGLAEGAVPEPSGPPSPWYVRTMLGVAGWLGALFLLGFVGIGLSFVFETELAALVAGAACCGAAFVIFQRAGRNDLASQFGLAVSLAGQVMVVYGLSDLVGNSSESAVFFFDVAVFEAALALCLANFVHRVWSTLASMIALGYAMNILDLPVAATGVVAAALAVLWLAEPDWAPRGALWRPVGYGLALALLQFDAVPLLGIGRWVSRTDGPDPSWIHWIGPILVGAVLVYTVGRLLARHGVAASSRTGGMVLGGATAVALATLNAPGVASSLLVLLLGFAGGNRTLHGIGVLGMLSYLTYFYYSLDATLLAKSAALGGTGVVLIALWAGTRALFGSAPDREAADA